VTKRVVGVRRLEGLAVEPEARIAVTRLATQVSPLRISSLLLKITPPARLATEAMAAANTASLASLLMSSVAKFDPYRFSDTRA
jgi:hypothetical protein